jgi:hypothetical protein
MIRMIVHKYKHQEVKQLPNNHMEVLLPYWTPL